MVVSSGCGFGQNSICSNGARSKQEFWKEPDLFVAKSKHEPVFGRTHEHS